MQGVVSHIAQQLNISNQIEVYLPMSGGEGYGAGLPGVAVYYWKSYQKQLKCVNYIDLV